MFKSPQSKKPTILVVDDDPSVLTMLESLFHDDAEIITANGGQMALALLRENMFYGHMPDLILADVHMPCGSGPTFIDSVESLGVKIPMVLLTTYLSDFRKQSDHSTFKFDKLREVVLNSLEKVKELEGVGV